MKKLETYLFFDGNCAEAMKFYEQALGGKISLFAAKDAPEGSFTPDQAGKTMHAKLEADGAVIMASDWMAPTPYPGMHGFAVSLSVHTAEEARSLFDKLAEGGRVTMPVDKTFYSSAFGMLTDRFGTPWMVIAD